MISSWHSYPKVQTLGHRSLQNFLDHEMVVQEKIDGSQFSFGWFPEKDDADGMGLMIRSKGAIIHADAPPKMFARAVDTVKDLRAQNLLVPGWTYRGEVVDKPQHNALTYDRIPVGRIILFDINDGMESYISYEDLPTISASMGLESVPALFTGRITSVAEVRRFLDTISCLGGQKIEGVVLKPKDRNVFGIDGKLLMGKFVSEEFKEVHKRTWGESNPSNKDIVQKLIDALATPARFNKALIHLREEDKITNSPKDIGLLIKYAQKDITEEEMTFVQDTLVKHFLPTIVRSATKGLPQWYKDLLLAQQFEDRPDASHEMVAD